MIDETLPLIGIIAKLDLKPTDIVVVKTRHPISHMTAVQIDRYMKRVFDELGVANKVLVLDDLDIQVISPTDGNAAA